MTVTSVSGLLSFADFGIGNGVLTAVSSANGRNDRREAQEIVSSTFYFLLLISVILAGLCFLAYPFVPWEKLYNVKSSLAASEAGPATVVFILCTGLNMPLGIVSRIQSGYQEGFQTALWTALSSLISLGCLVLAVSLKASLMYLVLSISGAQVLTALLNSAHQFGFSRRWLLPRPSAFRLGTCKKLLTTGTQFLVLQIMGLLAFGTDSIVLSHFAGLETVAQYSTANKLFSLIFICQSILLTPMWPAYTEAFQRKDYRWIKTGFVRSLVLVTGLAVVGSIPALLFSGPILRIWTKQMIDVPRLTLWGLAAWTLLSGFGNAIAMLMNALNRMRVQVVCSLLLGPCAFGLKCLLTPYFGSAGAVWATVLTYLTVVVVPVGLSAKHILASLPATASECTATPSYEGTAQ